MGVLAFSHFNLRAARADLDVLCAFYVEAVGLQVGPRPPFTSFGYWLYAGGAPVLHLSEAAAHEHRALGVTGTYDHAAFACTDRAGVEARLRALGVAFETARVPATEQVQLFFNDPAGNGVELNFSEASA